MTSSSKKKQRRKAAFQKVKLRLGRRIDKSRNDTDASFKTKKIQIRDQVKGKLPSDTNGKQKLNLQDFYHGINNSNANVRKDALLHFKNNVTFNMTTICSNLNEVMLHVIKLIEDGTADVRKLAIDVLQSVLKITAKDKLSVMFPIISNYLCCAMTHINSDIQNDSLDFLDFLLDHHSDCLISMHERLLSNFLEQVSLRKQTAHAESKSGSSYVSRSLIVDPKKRISAEMWRRRVFSRLNIFLQCLLKDAIGTRTHSVRQYQETNWNSKQQSYNSCRLWPKSAAASSSRYSSIQNGWTPSILHDQIRLKSFVDSLMPLLFETWKECSIASQLANSPSCALSSESLEFVHCLLTIIRTLIDCIAHCERNTTNSAKMQTSFLSKYAKDFASSFLLYFPFMAEVSNYVKQKKKNSGIATQALCSSLNLSVCIIFLKLEAEIVDENVKGWKNLVDYIDFLLSNKTLRIDYSMKTVTEVLKSVLQKPNKQSIKEKLLTKSYEYYCALPAGSNQKDQLQTFFLELTFNFKDHKVIDCLFLQDWIKLLPKIFIRHPTWDVIFAMKKLAPTKNASFLLGLQNNMSAMIERLLVLETKDQHHINICRAVLELIVWVPLLRRMEFVALANVLLSENIPSEIKSYSLQICSCRYFCNLSAWKTEAPLFISFFLNVIFGLSSSEINKLQSTSSSLQLINIIVAENFKENWEKHVILVEEACNTFKLLENFDQITFIMMTHLTKIKKMYSSLPLLSAWSILHVLCHENIANNLLNDLHILHIIVKILLSCMITEERQSIIPSKSYYSRLLSLDSIAEEFFHLLYFVITGCESSVEAKVLCQVVSRFIQLRKISLQQYLCLKEALEKFSEDFQDFRCWHSLKYDETLLVVD